MVALNQLKINLGGYMPDLDMERAENLLKSAKDLYEKGDMVGVAGVAYASFESATMA